jgi:hypothetical protein
MSSEMTGHGDAHDGRWRCNSLWERITRWVPTVGLPRARRRQYSQLPTDGSGKPIVNLAVPRNGASALAFRPDPPCVVTALVDLPATVVA